MSNLDISLAHQGDDTQVPLKILCQPSLGYAKFFSILTIMTVFSLYQVLYSEKGTGSSRIKSAENEVGHVSISFSVIPS